MIDLESRFAYLLDAGRKRDTFQRAHLKTFLPDVLDPARNFDAPETPALVERLLRDPPQRGRQPDALYRSSLENSSLALSSVDDLFLSEPLQSLVQLHAL